MKWIKVEDRLPDKDTYIFLYWPECDCYAQSFYYRGGASLEFLQKAGWSYWMPLPEPPEQK